MLIPGQVASPEGFWPITVAGWIALCGVFLSLLTTAFAWGRWAQKITTVREDLIKEFNNHKDTIKNQLDGFGGRVESMESEHDHINGRLEEASGHVQRILGQHDSILGLLGEARGSAVQCREDTQALGEKIERKLEGITTRIGAVELNLSQRLSSVETKIDFLAKEKS